MPRVCDSTSGPHDFCQGCMPDEEEAREQFGDMGDGPDGRGNCFEYEPEHPDYDGEDYQCELCGVDLYGEDN